MARSTGGYIGDRPVWSAVRKSGIFTLAEAYDLDRHNGNRWYTNEIDTTLNFYGIHSYTTEQQIAYMDFDLRGAVGGNSGTATGGYGAVVRFRYEPQGGIPLGQVFTFVVGRGGMQSGTATEFEGGNAGTGANGGGYSGVWLGQYHSTTSMEALQGRAYCLAIAGGGGGGGAMGTNGGTGLNGGVGGHAAQFGAAGGFGYVVSSEPTGPSYPAAGTTAGGKGGAGYYRGGGGGGGGSNGGGGGGMSCYYCGNIGGSGGTNGNTGSMGSGSSGGDRFTGGSSSQGGGGGAGWFGGGGGGNGNGTGHAGAGGGGAGSSYIDMTHVQQASPYYTSWNPADKKGQIRYYFGV